MITKEEWNKKWPQLAYNPSLLEGNNAEKALNMTLDEKIKASKEDAIETRKQAEEYKLHRKVVIQTPAQETFNNDEDY